MHQPIAPTDEAQHDYYPEVLRHPLPESTLVIFYQAMPRIAAAVVQRELRVLMRRVMVGAIGFGILVLLLWVLMDG